MCVLSALPALGAFGGASTAAGATAAATTGSFLQTAGLAAAVAAPIIGGIQANQTAQAQADLLNRQGEAQAPLTAIEDARTRRQFRSQIAGQRAQFAARGVSSGSPSAVYLGQTAAEEMAFASQSVRQTGSAQQAELSASAQMVRARGRSNMLTGMFTGAGTLLSGAPKLWPELLA